MGSSPRRMRTRVGDITFAVPQVREGGFYPEALEKGLRSERALNAGIGRDVCPRCLDPQGESHHRAVMRSEHLFVCGEPSSHAVG